MTNCTAEFQYALIQFHMCGKSGCVRQHWESGGFEDEALELCLHVMSVMLHGYYLHCHCIHLIACAGPHKQHIVILMQHPGGVGALSTLDHNMHKLKLLIQEYFGLQCNRGEQLLTACLSKLWSAVRRQESIGICEKTF